MKRTQLQMVVAVFVLVLVLVLVLSWVFHGTGIVKNDLTRNIFIPEVLTIPL